MALGGTVAGLVIGFAAIWLLARLKDRLLEIVISFLSAFASYLLAEAFHVSGVLAAVACGGVVGRNQLKLTAGTRLETNSAWELVEFILTSLVFLLIGLQLRGILESLADIDPWQLVWVAAAVSGTLILSRIVWVFATSYPATALMKGLRGEGFIPPLSYPTIISWAGMRGVVSLAAALALPFDFPGRALIVFLAFCSILTTLVLQGTTLGWVIRRFDLTDSKIEAARPEIVTARKEVATAALEIVSGQISHLEHGQIAESLVQDFKDRVDLADRLNEDAEAAQRGMNAELQLRLSALAAARTKLVERRDELDGETLGTLVQELDLEEEQIRVTMNTGTIQAS